MDLEEMFGDDIAAMSKHLGEESDKLGEELGAWLISKRNDDDTLLYGSGVTMGALASAAARLAETTAILAADSGFYTSQLQLMSKLIGNKFEDANKRLDVMIPLMKKHDMDIAAAVREAMEKHPELGFSPPPEDEEPKVA
jgi:hypothetical protein